jgi:hypothetical protein
LCTLMNAVAGLLWAFFYLAKLAVVSLLGFLHHLVVLCSRTPESVTHGSSVHIIT